MLRMKIAYFKKLTDFWNNFLSPVQHVFVGQGNVIPPDAKFFKSYYRLM